jgi:hypothetical protein
MRLPIFVAAAALGLPLMASSSNALESTSPGKSSVYAQENFVGLSDAGFLQELGATISKGKPKRVLAVEVSVQFDGQHFADILPSMTVVVNGVGMIGGDGGVVTEECAAGRQCVLVGTWWLDLDVAEAANPGLFNKVPLDVGVLMKDDNGLGLGAGGITLTARMEKK